MVELGGAGLGLVVGWLLPIVRVRDRRGLGYSALAVVVVILSLWFISGLSGAVGAAAGAAGGAWLHAALLELLAARSGRATEG